MKKSFLAVVTALVLSQSGFSLDQVFLEPSIPNSPALMAQGGVSTPLATGWQSLFINPAAFAVDKPEITLLSVETTGNVSLSFLSQLLQDREYWSNTNYLDSSNPMTTLINDLLTKSGLGGEVAVGSGWVGGNLGVGVSMLAKSRAKGTSLLGSKLTTDVTIQGIIGMGWPVTTDWGTLRFGGDVRPIQRSYMVVPVTDVMSNMANLSAYTISSGFGLGWDLGFRWDWNHFQTGVAIRDLGGTMFSFKEYSLDAWASQFGLPSSGGTSDGTTLYRVPTVIALGTAWKPEIDGLSSLVRPTLGVDLQIPLKDEYTQTSFWTWTHIGAEVEFLKFLAFRTGINQGYFTFGMGAKLWILDMNVAYFTEETGRYSGVSPRPALAFDWAFRL